jgi:O-methyltransferase
MREDPAARRYLDLLNDSMTGVLTGPTFAPPRYRGMRGRLVAAVDRVLAHWQLVIARHEEFDLASRLDGYSQPLTALTQMGRRRLEQLEAMVRTILDEQVDGDVLEAGAWRGGSGIFLRGALDVLGGGERTLWVADSFAGYPAPGSDASTDDVELHANNAYWELTRAQMEDNFRRYRLLSDKVQIIEGWFDVSLPRAPLGPLAMVRLDVDGYEGARAVLERCHPLLSPGGFMVVEDVRPAGALRAVREFRAGLTPPWEETPGRPNAIFWRKQ